MMPSARRRFILRATLGYAACAAAWIFLSDQLLAVFGDIYELTWLGTLKGLVFVLVTTTLLYFALHAVPGGEAQQAASQDTGLPPPARAPWSLWLSYAFAIALTALVLLVRAHMGVPFGDRPLLVIFVLPIVLSALLGGVGPGLVSTALATLGANYFFVAPAFSLHVFAPHDAFQLGILAATGVLVSILSDRLRRAQWQTEKTLRRQLDIQNQLAKIAASVPGVIHSFRLRPDGTACMPFTTPAIEDLFGVSQAAMARDVSAWHANIHPDDVRRVDEAFAQAARGPTPWHDQYRYLHPVKGLRWIEGWSVPQADPDGSIVWHGFLMDITERRRAEAELRRRERLLDQTSRLAKVGGWEFDVATMQGSWTDEVARILDVDPSETASVAQGISFFQGESRATIDRASKAAIEIGTPYDLELELTSAKGVRKWVRTVGVPIPQDGPVTRVEGAMQDITERKRVGAELEQHRRYLEELVATRTTELAAAEAHTRLILDSTADGLYGIDTEGRVTFVNPAACKLLGYTPGQLIGNRVHALVHYKHADGSPYPAEDCPVLASTIAGEMTRKYDDVYWHADGHAIPVSLAAQPMMRNGQCVGAVVSFFDNSVRKAAEAAREYSLAEARRLAEVRSEFLANMSHEIRTPLNAVLGFAQIGQREDAGRKSEKIFERILDSGQHLLGIVNDILDFSKIDSGKFTIEQTQFDLGNAIDRAVDFSGARAYAKGLDFLVEEAADLPARCLGDALRLSQVLANLLANAVKFTETGTVMLAVSRDGDFLVFRVSDCGIGMSAEQLDRLFRAFEQADGSTTRRFGGTGLGLSITHRLVNLMGGRIRVESSPGRGSVFEVHLPLRDAVPADRTPQGSVALVGMAEIEADRLATMLEAHGIECSIAAVERIPATAVLVVSAGPSPAADALAGCMDRGQRVAIIVNPGANSLSSALRERARIVERPLRVRHLLAALTAGPRPPRAQPALPRLAGISILAAEDNDVNRLVLQEMLAMEGAQLLCLENGRLAVDALRDAGPDAFDLVLTDIQMPEMNGYEVARRIGELAPGLPVVGLTAHAMPEERVRCLEAGMVEHVSKPVTVNTLVEVILRHARKRTTARSQGGASAQRPQHAAIDRAGLLERFQGRRDFIAKLLATVVKSHSKTPARLRELARHEDLAELASLAHTLKGMAGNVNAKGVQDLAARTVAAARDASPNATELALRLADEIDDLIVDAAHTEGNK